MAVRRPVKDAGTKDLSLSTLACRALYNVYMTGTLNSKEWGEGGEGREDAKVAQEMGATRDRLRSSVWVTLDELEDVVSDMVEDFEDDAMDPEDEEWRQCRDFLSVVRPMLEFFSQEVERGGGEEEEGKTGEELRNNVGTEARRRRSSGEESGDGNDLVPLEDPKNRKK